MQGPPPTLFPGEPPESTPDAPTMQETASTPQKRAKPTEVPQKTPLLGSPRHHGPHHALASFPSGLCLPHGICSRQGAQACGVKGTLAPGSAPEHPPRKPSGRPLKPPQSPATG